ncbi:MAG: hypothetical protein NVS2B12_24980 [Ktedonobacteraceae bacterium]
MPTTIEQLQQLGLNKYEAEAYYTLLKHGSLTGYEVGKHSQVPLSRSYDVLERLVDKGLALVQPGEPVRYRAQDPQRFLGQVRVTMEETLEALTTTLTSLSHSDEGSEFWVVRGRQNIIERCQEVIAATHSQLELSIPAIYHPALAAQLAQSQQRGVHIFQFIDHAIPASDYVCIVRDDQEALLGTLSPSDTGQAIVSSNTALLIALHGYFDNLRSRLVPSVPITVMATRAEPQGVDWMDWETRKHARLRILSEHHRVA